MINELHILASNHGVAIETEEDEIIQGWMNKPKGLLQILWEQGWINPNENINDYVKDKRKSWLDLRGKVLEQFENDAKKLFLLICFPNVRILSLKVCNAETSR